MTVQTEFVSWQTHPKKPQPGKCSPIGTNWMRYLLATWGGQNLGCYASRPIVGGTAPSSHQSGAAIDWRYQNPGVGRPVVLTSILPWLTGNSLELGVQAIHDYAGKRIWRPPGCSGRSKTPSPQCGWQANNGVQMNPANTWLHIECLPSRWGDTRTVEQMLATTPKPPTPKPPTPSEPEDDVNTPAVVWLGDGRIDHFVRGDDGQLWHNWYQPGHGWMNWQGLGGLLVGSPGATSEPLGDGNYRIDVSAKGVDGALWHIWWDGAEWQPWESVWAWPS